MKIWEHKAHKFLTILLSCGVSVFFIFCLYFTPAGAALEDRFFILRSMLKPNLEYQAEFKVLSHPLNSDSYSLNVLRRINSAGPRRLAVLLTGDYSNYSARFLEDLFAIAKQSERILIGVPSLDSVSPYKGPLPRLVVEHPGKVFGFTELRGAKKSLMHASYGGYQGFGRRNLLHSQLSDIKISDYAPEDRFLINYVSAAAIDRIDISALEALSSRQLKELLADDTLVIQVSPKGPIRDYPPYAAYDEELEWSHWVVGLAINLREKVHLRPVSILANIGQIVAVSFVMGGVWFLGPASAVFITIIGWLCLIFSHSLIMNYLNVFVPLSDTFLFGLLAGMAGAMWRLAREGQLRIEQEVRTESQKFLAQTQTKFLDNFSNGLASINDRVISVLQSKSRALKSIDTLAPVFERLSQSAGELRDYLAGIQSFVRITKQANVSIKAHEIEVLRLLQSVVGKLSSKCDERGIDLVVDCPPRLVILSAQTLLELILLNLLSNAINFSPKKGLVRIRVKECKKRMIALSIIDQGPGIDPAYQDLIFEKFYRIEGEGQLSSKGIGLGLYLSRFFAAKIGAQIVLESKPTQGACFTVYIPRAK